MGGDWASGVQTIVVLTALEEERRAVLRHVGDGREHVDKVGTRYDVAPLPTPGWQIAVASGARGNSAMAALTGEAIHEFAPAAVLLVGIAGAIDQRLSLGGVVVATKVYGIHGGRDDLDGFKIRAPVWQPPVPLLELAKVVDRDHSWRQSLPDSSASTMVSFAPTAAGEVVLNNPDSALANHIRQHYNDAVAVDTEDLGFAETMHWHRNIEWLVIRGVSDLAGWQDKHATDALGWRQIAADHAAAYAMAVLARFAAEAGPPSPAPHPVPATVPPNVMGYAFISASPDDRTFAARLATQLEAAGTATWYDASPGAGAKAVRITTQKLDQAAVVIPVLSAAADKSDRVRNEIDRARQNHLPIIPLALDGYVMTGLDSGHGETVAGSAAPSARFVEAVAQVAGRFERFTLAGTLSGHNGRVGALAFAPKSPTLVSGGDDATVRVWDVSESAGLRLTINNGMCPTWPVAFTADGMFVASAARELAGVHLWGPNDALHRSIGDQTQLVSFAFSPDGAILAAGSADRTTKIWDARSGTLIDKLTAGRSVPGWPLVFAPDSLHLAVANLGSHTVSIWHVRQLQQVTRLQGHHDRICDLTFTSNGSQIVTASADGTARVWDVATGDQLLELNAQTGPVRAVACSPDGRLAATAGTDQNVRLWHLATGRQLQVLTGHSGEIGTLAFSADGAILASAGADRIIRLWRR